MHGYEVMTVTLHNSSTFANLTARKFEVSWQAAYAWTLTMVFTGSDGKLVVAPLIERVAVVNDGTAHLNIGGCHSLQANQMELENSSNIWADALTWTFYTEEVFSETGELLPVPQYLLKIRETALQDLQDCIDFNQKMEELFKDNAMLKQKIIRNLELGWSELLQAESGETTFRSFSPDLHVHSDIWPLFEALPLFKALYANYAPRERQKQKRKALENTTLEGLLARVIIATSVIQRWRREEWHRIVITDGGENDGSKTFAIPPNPAKELFWPSQGPPKAVYLT